MVVLVSVYHDEISTKEYIEIVYGVSVGEILVVTVLVMVEVATYFVRVYVGGDAYDLVVEVPES